jgi:Sulfotransferase family
LSKSVDVPAWGNSVSFARTPRYKQTRAWAWGRQTWLGEVTRASRKFQFEISSWLSYAHASVPSSQQLAESIALLPTPRVEMSDETEQQAPIFLLSTGWRAGSTLLQRILVTDQQLLLWGEPLGEMALVSRLAEMVSQLITPVLLHSWGSQMDAKSPTLSKSWIANLYPSADDFRSAMRGLFDQWLGRPALELGFARWGFKEVRLGATEASLLHWLYPNAKFVIIYRHPYDSYRSLADSHWETYYRYPDVPVNSAAGFAHLWNRLAMSWSELPPGFPCFHIKYEDLTRGQIDFRKLESWLGIKIKENLALSTSVGRTAKRKNLTWYERLIIAREANAGMNALGYSQ